MPLFNLFAYPQNNNLRLPKEEFYTVMTSDQEILSALCEPKILKTLKRAVKFVLKSYNHSFTKNLDPQEIESEVLLKVFQKIKRRNGLTFPNNYHERFDL